MMIIDDSYKLIEIVRYANGAVSEFYSDGSTAVIIDRDICRCETEDDVFSYSLITDKQNGYMKKYSRVFRFLEDEADKIKKYIDHCPENVDFLVRRGDRSDSAEASPLEFLFEQNFVNVYGNESIGYLYKEYGIADFNGNNYYLDYCVRTKDGLVAVEENGLTYHHPQIIGVERYRRQLQKQNTCALWGIKLYRFSTEDCRFAERIEDDIRLFFGADSSVFTAGGVNAERGFRLYEHQENCLEEIEKTRSEGKKSFLAVFPTASGKSRIIEEDISRFRSERSDEESEFRVLVLVPTLSVANDWEKRADISFSDYRDDVYIRTFAAATRDYYKYPSDYYNYIVIDEAHHAVAPVLKRVIQYYTPDFLIGLTATDERMDKKRLEAVFGSYSTGLTLPEAMEKKIVAQARVYRVETNLDLSTVRVNGKEFVNADLEKGLRVSSRNDLICDVVSDYFCQGEAGKRQGVVFCVNTQHAKEMAKLLNERGISASAFSSKEKNPAGIMKEFCEKKIRFLCACNMISEGWDYPELGILIMARPTLSKVLYMQQIGRGLRRTDRKRDVFVVDVVDEYGAMVSPCSMHSIFRNSMYVPFAPITQREFNLGDMIIVDGIKERIDKITEVDVESFGDKYGDYLSEEQLAREYFISTATVKNWIRTGKLEPTVSLPFGNRRIHLFNPDYVEKMKEELNIGRHDDTTIYGDFFDFLEERDYTFSYKMIFILSFLEHINEIGEAPIQDVLFSYAKFYKERLGKGLNVDRKGCPYTMEYLNNEKKIRENMLSNPFEKYERKRFMYYSKNLGMLALNHALFEKLDEGDFDRIKKQMEDDLENYYSAIDGEKEL